MKFSLLTIACAVASANAAIRGDTAAGKEALMRKITDAANKKAFGALRRLEGQQQQQEEEEDEYEQNGEYEDEEEVSSETKLQPFMCVTAKVYNYNADGGEGEDAEEGEENNNNYNYNAANADYAVDGQATMSYLSFTSVENAEEDGQNVMYGNAQEYMTTLPTYLSAIGTAWAEEQAQLCEDCEIMQDFCQMSYEERMYFAQMTEEEFEEYMEEMEREYEEDNERYQQENYEEMEEEQNNAYAAYSGGDAQGNVDQGYDNNAGGNYDAYGYRRNRRLSRRRRLYQSVMTLCETCQQKCVDDDMVEQSQEFYEEMEELFADAMCTQTDSGLYIGHTCGGDGKSIELAMFSDANCMYLVEDADAYEEFFGDGEVNAQELGYGYMQLVTEMFDDEYSCALGAIRTYEGADPSEACENLFDASISSKDCYEYTYENDDAEYGEEGEEGENNQNQYQNQYQYNNGANGYAAAAVPEGYDMYYSEDVADVCSQIMSLEAHFEENRGWQNPFTGATFKQLYGQNNSGFIAGIVIAVIAAVAAAAYVYHKKTAKKSELEEPVFQGEALS